MNGAESLVKTLLANGADLCFANPGTSEMHFIAALDKIAGMRCVLTLFEGVATGAADGYFRLKQAPATTLLHLSPGLANGLSNLHNAKKAGSGIVNIVGEHASFHLQHDAPLTGDTEGVAWPMSHWVRTAQSSAAVAHDAADALAVARATPHGIATLILPADASWGPATEVACVADAAAPQAADAQALQAATVALLSGGDAALLLGGQALRSKALDWAGRIAARTGCKLLCEGHNALLQRGAGRVRVERLPHDVARAYETMQGITRLVLVGAKIPVAFFAYPNQPSLLVPTECEVIALANAGQDVEGALEALARELDAPAGCTQFVAQRERPGLPHGKITPQGIAATLVALIPEQTIVVDESISVGHRFFPLTGGAAPHDWLNSVGASLGYALPVAIGAAIAAPDRRVLALVGDGSAMYTLQALWTMAREALNITVVILANRSYNVLRGELNKIGVSDPGPTALGMLSLSGPELDWVALARGHGVPAGRAHDLGELAREMQRGLSGEGPYLIELLI